MSKELDQEYFDIFFGCSRFEEYISERDEDELQQEQHNETSEEGE